MLPAGLGLVVALLIFWVYSYLKMVLFPRIKGGIGEFGISLRLRRLPKNEYIVLNDVLLKVGESTTQIDHIVISKSGLFVIETKNYKGWIHGHEKSEYWKQTLFYQRYWFKNPIHQNKIHVFVLRNILTGYPRMKYFPIVVFNGSGVLKNVINWSPVIYSQRLIRTIRENDDEFNLSFDQMKSIYDQLNRLRLWGRMEDRNHVKRVKKKIRENYENSISEACPKCGSDLIKRKGKFGEFYGCSNFPRCSHTQKISKKTIN